MGRVGGGWWTEGDEELDVAGLLSLPPLSTCQRQPSQLRWSGQSNQLQQAVHELILQDRLVVPAGKATAAPPIGPALGARGVKSMDFCKEFNRESSSYRPGTS